MTFIRIKVIKGHPYYYEQTSVWKDGKVKTKHVRYIGKSLKKISGTTQEKKSNRLTVDNLKTVPQKPGVYYLYNRKGDLIYIGTADNLKTRISECGTKINSSYFFRWRGSKTMEDANILAREEIKLYDPKYNRDKK